MWSVAPLWALLVWCFGVVNTFSAFDGAADYWYSNDDGIILESLTPYTLYRSRDISNKSNVVKSHSNSTVRRLGKLHEIPWMLKFDDDGEPIVYDDTYNRRNNPAKDKILKDEQNRVNPAETWLCTAGPDKVLDSCNHCVCLGGQLYLCTAKKCQAPDAAGVWVHRTYRENNYDTCIEGETIKSYDCNRCWCSGGKVLCTIKTCSKPRDTPNNNLRPIDDLMEKNSRCHPGESQHGIDNCNTCGCNRRGELFCSAMTCGISASTYNDKEAGCIENSWYSMQSDMPGGELECRECFCVNRKYAFCFFKLCQGTLAPPQGSTCKPGAQKNDECTQCNCTSKREWRCYTRLINKCSDKTGNTRSNGTINKIIRTLNGKDEENIDKTSVNVDYDSISEETTTTKKKKTRTTTTTAKSVTEESEYEETEESDRQTTKKRTPNIGGLPEGTQCEEGEAFNMGTMYNCQGCFCTAEGQWRCFSVKTACRGWRGGDCRKNQRGKFDRNPNIPCSFCYCGTTRKWMCFTDEACSQKITKTSCDAIICADNCKGAKWTDGFCHQDHCVCL